MTEGIILLVCLICLIFMLDVLGPTLAKSSESEKIMLIVLGGITFFMSILALRKVFQRWYEASSDIVIAPNRDIEQGVIRSSVTDTDVAAHYSSLPAETDSDLEIARRASLAL